MRGGYTDVRVSEDAFTVSFQGNAYTGSASVDNYFLRRCAEVSAQNGYQYFVIAESQAQTKTEFVQTARATASTTGSVHGSTFDAKTKYTPAQYEQVNRYVRKGVIQAYKEGKQPAGALRSADILASFRDEDE